MESGTILQKIHENSAKIENLKKLKQELRSKVIEIGGVENKYEYNNAEWTGNKEREVAGDLGLFGFGIYEIRDQIVKDATTVITNISNMIQRIQKSNETLEIDYKLTRAREAAASEKERERQRRIHMNS